MTSAATTVTNADTVAVPARNTRRTCGCAPDGFGSWASSVGVVGFVEVIGWLREPRRSRAPERTRRLGVGSGAGRDVRMETLARGRGTGERHAADARPRHHDRAGADRTLDLGRRVVLGRRDPRPRARVLRA